MAVAKGAKVIEKHFTLDRKMDGPDHSFALEPGELKEMVGLIREAEKTIIRQDGEYTKSEERFKKAKRSVVSTRDLKAGEILTEDNTTTKRPCLEDSVEAIDYFHVLGQSISSPVKADTPISRNQVSYYYK